MPQTVIVKHSDEAMLCDIDCSLILAPSESITGVTQLASAPAGLTFGAPVINLAATTYPDGRRVEARRVIQVVIGGGEVPAGQLGREYVVTARFTTTTPGELREARCRLLVTNEP